MYITITKKTLYIFAYEYYEQYVILKMELNEQKLL